MTRHFRREEVGVFNILAHPRVVQVLVPSVHVTRILVDRRAQAKRVAEIHRITGREAIQIQPARQADGIFLRKTPDRT
jgi:hypothetical protein